MPYERAQRVMYDGLYTFAVRLLRIGFVAALGVLTARILGPSGRGVYALPGVQSALVASAFGGLTSATSYFLLNRNPGRSYVRIVLLSALVLIAAAAIAVIPLTFFSGQQWAALPAIVVLPSLALLSTAAGYAVGIKRVRYSTTLAFLQTLFTFGAMLFVLTAVSHSPGAAIGAWIAGTTIAGIVSLAYMLLDLRTRPAGGDPVRFGEYFHFCMRVSLVNVITLLNYRADLYIVALFLPPAELGMYSIAVAGAESLLVPTQVTALVTSPHIGSLDLPSAAQLTARCVRNNLLIALVVCGVLYVFATPVVDLLYGKSFVPLVPAFKVLLIGVVALSMSSPVSSYFTLKLGRPQVALWLAALSAVICISSSILLVGTLGMLGAAIGSTGGYLVGQTVALWYFGRQAGIGLRVMLVPTVGDFATYGSFAHRLLQDGKRLLRPVL